MTIENKNYEDLVYKIVSLIEQFENDGKIEIGLQYFIDPMECKITRVCKPTDDGMLTRLDEKNYTQLYPTI